MADDKQTLFSESDQSLLRNVSFGPERRKRRAKGSAALLAIAAVLLFPAIAWADPCEGELPRIEGAVFGGVVRYVGDGDSLCASHSDDPATWIEVRLAEFNAPELADPGGREAKATLQQVALNRSIRCTVVRGRNGRTTSHDRTIAICMIGGRSVGALLREAGVQEGGN